MTAIVLTKTDFEEKVLKSDKPVLVDFFAIWCGPCRLAGPVLDELAEKYQGKAVIAKLNVDEQPELAEKYQVMSIPTVLVFKDGKEIGREIGFIGKDGYEQMILKNL